MPCEPKASASSSCLSPRSEKDRTHARAQYVLLVLSAGAPRRAPWNAGSIGSEERVFCELPRTPSWRSSHVYHSAKFATRKQHPRNSKNHSFRNCLINRERHPGPSFRRLRTAILRVLRPLCPTLGI